MSELKISYCIKCGANNAGYLTELGGGRYKCRYCSSEYREESATKDIEHILSSMGWTVEDAVNRGLYAAKEEKIANARRYLYKAVHDEYLSDKEIVKWADAIKAENAGDFMAEFYTVAVSKNVREINDFLDAIDVCEKEDYLEDVVEFMLKTADYGNILSVENLIDAGIHDERQTEYLNRVHDLAENLKSGLYDTEVPRDAFIAYSSKDFRAVNKIVTELEEQGLECFVAMRNLRHGKGARENYITELQKAMNCCECFVFISSQNSRRPDCDAIKIELPYMRDVCKDKPRIEFVLDTVQTGNVAELKVKKFFDGLEYCRDVTDLAERICLAMEGGLQTAPQQTIALSSSPKKYCVHCLTENDEDVRFCKECGKNEFSATLAEASARYKALAKEEAQRELEAAREAEEAKKAEEARKKEEERKAEEAKRAKDTLAEIAINDQKKRAAKSAEAEAFYQKANDYFNGTNGVKQDYEKAVELYLNAARMGHLEAQCSLGVCYDYGHGVTKSYRKAADWYKKAAERGLARAQNNYGNLYYNGHGVEQSFTIAVEWYRKAAEQGYANAECWLGVCYEFGRGVEQSQQKAVEWYRKAAGKGNAAAQCNLGYCYEIGKGVTQDYAKAVEWYRKAAEQGHARAQCNLGVCYENGNGVTADIKKAVELYRKSAEQGYARGQFNLGLCYEYGNGVRLSKNKAAEWYKKAAAQGYSGAEEALKRVSR